MAKTFKVSLSGPLLDQVTEMAANDEVENSEVIRRILWLWYIAGSRKILPPDTEAPEDGLTPVLDEAQCSYRRSLDAYVRIQKALIERPVEAGKEDPLLADLDLLGDAVSHVPGLVEELRKGRRVGEQIRRQAEAHGLIFRYDRNRPVPKPQNDP